MKKVLMLLVMMAGMLSFTNAQRVVTMPTVYGDTVITSSSLDTVIKTISITAGYSALGIQIVATKVSGTITSKAYLYGSIDNVNYTVTDSTSAFANAAGAQTVFFTKTGGLPYAYYRIHVRPPGGATSTESLAVKVYYVARKYDN